jgi:hypothetical protein
VQQQNRAGVPKSLAELAVWQYNCYIHRKAPMQAYKETTVWDSNKAPNHTYLLDGTTLVAYIKQGEKKPFYFKNPIKGFDKRGRKFELLKKNPFKEVVKTELREVQGSKGDTYYVNDEEHTCTCPGFTFRGSCKHILQTA